MKTQQSEYNNKTFRGAVQRDSNVVGERFWRDFSFSLISCYRLVWATDLSGSYVGTVAGSYFWDTFFIFRKYDMPIPTLKRRIFMTIAGSYITKLADSSYLTVALCIKY